MGQAMKNITVGFLAFLVTLSFLHVVYSSSLRVLVMTDKPTYSLGEYVLVSGNVTFDEEPVPDGLVMVEVDDPRNDVIAIRTRPTGPVAGVSLVEIVDLEVEPDPVKRKQTVEFNITIRVIGASPRNVTVTLNTYYSNGVPFELILPAWEGTLYPGWPKEIRLSMQIDEYAPLGTATVYASAFTYQKLPKNEGFAYCPEKMATFTITESTTTSSSLAGNPVSENGTFDLTVAILSTGGMLGNYAVYACSYYSHLLILNHTNFEVKLIGDITGPDGVPDGKVDMKDLGTVAKAFGSQPGDPRWNPIADLNPDGKIDMKDIGTCARDYGKWGVLP